MVMLLLEVSQAIETEQHYIRICSEISFSIVAKFVDVAMLSLLAMLAVGRQFSTSLIRTVGAQARPTSYPVCH